MNDDSILGNTLGQLGSIVKKTGQEVGKTLTDIIENTEEQKGRKKESTSGDNGSKQASASDRDSDKNTEELVKGLYAKSDDVQKTDKDKEGIKGQPEFQKQIANKSSEEQKKRLQLHLKLHKEEYYDPTFNPPKRQEERPAEEIEKEKKEKKQMEALELQRQDKKKEELAPSVKQGTHEKVPGISG